MYTYKAKVLRWVDGDTVSLELDLGFNISLIERFRLLGTDTPERSQPLWTEAKQCSESVLPVGTYLTITTHKKDKYGRWLVSLPQVTQALTEKGLLKNASI